VMRQILQRARVAAAGQERPRINTHGQGQEKEGRTVPYRLQREYGPAHALRGTDFRCLTSRFLRQYISVVLSHPACGHFFCGLLPKLIHNMIKWDLFTGMQGWFSIHKTTNVIHHINRMKEKNNRLISIDGEKHLTKIQHAFMVKLLTI